MADLGAVLETKTVVPAYRHGLGRLTWQGHSEAVPAAIQKAEARMGWSGPPPAVSPNPCRVVWISLTESEGRGRCS
jgi:hypothetical protein